MEMTLGQVRTPALVVIESKMRANCRAMLDRAASLGCELRPHFKTVKALEAVGKMTGGALRRVVCSTLAEAQFLADGGVDDVLYAVPITQDKLPQARQLLQRLESFHVLVDAPGGVDMLGATGDPWSVVVCVDCGYGRDGLDPAAPESRALVQRVADHATLRFKGIYTHGGHAYDCQGRDAVAAVAAAERDAVVGFARGLRDAGVECEMVGVGSTPTCSVPPADGLEGVSEMHPGNYVYYDMMQTAIGVCAQDAIAVRVATRVVGHYPTRGVLLVDCGWTGCSAQGAHAGYGAFLEHPGLKVRVLKQEAGEVVSADPENAPLDFERYPVGSLLFLAPWHACAATHQHRTAIVVADDLNTITGRWEICKGW